MKGLLIKDVQMIKKQLSLVLVLGAILVGISFFSDDTVFPVSFFTYFIGLMAISTISQDDMSKGQAYLFCLPVSRTQYVLEKYLLSFLSIISAWLMSFGVILLSGQSPHHMSLNTFFVPYLFVLFLCCLLTILLIPVYLKFGGEKSRHVIMITFAGLFLAYLQVTNVSDDVSDWFASLVNQVLGIELMVLISFGVLIISCTASLSVLISKNIMQKKEF
ncbi:ABC-2 transporter permease [Streptococcus thoraltensis]|uniref:ABC-2 transporter permease n=1 Tax=Streptococcus thoraltensis TaxID=55085 RepID=UPI002A808902|nr:ABC-2 transporter permease [Streptococcus thoraltensis]MDY4761248.1 ABC-2 transporter permease [Streptococcus thoraltensis]